MQTLFLILQLTLFVDHCDAGTCTVYAGLYDEDDAGPITMPRSALPPCAREGSLVGLGGAVSQPWVHGQSHEVWGHCDEPRDEPTEEPRMERDDDDTWCPASPGHKR